MTYKDIFSPSKGSIFQRLLKFWIIPRFPRLAITVYTILGVGLFKRFLMSTVGKVGAYSSSQTNYHIGKPSMNHMLSFATTQTMFNEFWHFFAFLLTCLPQIISLIDADGFRLSGMMIFLLLVSALNIYCVMLQRYNRARMVLVIERMINRGYRPDHSFNNWLALDVPIEDPWSNIGWNEVYENLS